MPLKFGGQTRDRRAACVSRATFEVLETRRLLSVTTPATALTAADRQALLNDWIGSDKSTLSADLSAKNYTKFDSDLLSYVTNTSGALGKFFYNPSSFAADLSFIQANDVNTTNAMNVANSIVSHIFPNGNETYNVQLPAGNVTWLSTTATSGTEDLHEMNRQDWFRDLALAYRLTGSSTYATELEDEMATWSLANPALANPSNWANGISWYLLDSSQRAENWIWTYFTMLGSSAWTPQANTLFLYEMDLHGQFLDVAAAPTLADNRTVQQAQSLLSIGQLFPDFAKSSKWVTDGRNLMYTSMDAQIYPDGSDREQSPGYADEILLDLLEQNRQDSLNGYTWSSTQLTRLRKGFGAFVAMLDPNGERSAQGDSERAAEGTLLSEATLAGLGGYPEAKPRILDVLLFGATTAATTENDPIDPPPPTRGLTYELPNSGNYIFRSSGTDPDAEQITFNAGPKGGGHGHDDVLNFELFAYGRAMIADTGPWAYDTSAQRSWAMSTPSSNTVSVDNTSAGPLDGLGNPDIQLEQWTVGDDSAQVTAQYYGYGALAGQPVLARSIWYNYDGIALIVDWTESPETHTYTVSYNVDTTATMNEDGSIQTNDSDANVKITPLLTAGQTTAAENSITFGGKTFTPFADFSDSEQPGNATRYVIQQKTTNAVFGSLISVYGGTVPSDVTATWVGTPQPGHAAQIELDDDGVMQTINFAPPVVTQPGAAGTVDSQYTSIAYNGSTLEMAFYNPDSKLLEYTQRGPSGVWSAVSIIDAEVGAGVTPSLAVNAEGNTGVAYTDAAGVLKYSVFSGGTWSTMTVSSDASVDPSLAFSRNNGAVISYYDSKTKSLDLATTATSGFTITKVDTGTDVGMSSHLKLDASRPTATKWAIAYENTSTHVVKYAVQYKSGWDIETVGKATGQGTVGVTFNSSSEPVVSYYSAATSDDYVATDSGTYGEGGTWTTWTASGVGLGGASDSVFFDKAGKLVVLYSDAKQHKVLAALFSGKTPSQKTLASAGGVDVAAAISGTSLSFTNLNGSKSTVSTVTAP